MSFSERHGYRPSRQVQRDTMDDRLKNGLWNAIAALFERMRLSMMAMYRLSGQSAVSALAMRIWVDFLGEALDRFPANYPGDAVRQWFFGAEWFRVYDLLEFISVVIGDHPFEDQCNHALARENSAYRLVQGRVIEETDQLHVHAIDDAIRSTSGIPAVHEHLKTAIARLSDRPNPDYRNAMKEAISAVEALARLVAGVAGGTLADALKSFERRSVPLHPALNKAWLNIYGYTSDTGGVRHPLTDESSIGLPDAMFLVVSCSAFVSYLLELARRAGVVLSAPA